LYLEGRCCLVSFGRVWTEDIFDGEKPRYSCQAGDWVAARSKLAKASTLKYSDISGLEQSIDAAYRVASQRIYEIFQRYRFMDHLVAMKSYRQVSIIPLTRSTDIPSRLHSKLTFAIPLPPKTQPTSFVDWMLVSLTTNMVRGVRTSLPSSIVEDEERF